MTSTSTSVTSSKSNIKWGPPSPICAFNLSMCSDSTWPTRRMVVPGVPEVLSILKVVDCPEQTGIPEMQPGGQSRSIETTGLNERESA
jgi:hypothetical protein